MVDFARVQPARGQLQRTGAGAHVARAELKRHLFSLPDHPDWIPYRTSYYNEAWGFCVTHRALEQLTEPEYDVCIDSTLDRRLADIRRVRCCRRDRGRSAALLPRLPPVAVQRQPGGHQPCRRADQAASGLARDLRYTYRVLFIPGTIGSITWLAQQSRTSATAVKHGLVITCVGHGAKFTYKRSRRGDAEIDRIVEHVLAKSGTPFEVQAVLSVGIRRAPVLLAGIRPAGGLPDACAARARFPNTTPPRTTSSSSTADALTNRWRCIADVVAMIEENQTYVNQQPYGEPQLGKRGLYAAIGGDSKSAERQLTMLWVLNLSDGQHSLLDIAERAGIPFDEALATARLLEQHGLLQAVESSAALT